MITMGVEAKKATCFDEFLKVPDHLHAEIVAEQLFVAPRSGSEHSHATSKLGRKVGVPFDDGIGGPGGWWILDEPELHLQGDILVPDLAGWKLDMYPDIKKKQSYHTIVPNWVCEVLSPSTAGFDRVRKMPIYAREKVDQVWLIDPGVKTLEVYARNESAWTLVTSFYDNDVVRAIPFDSIEFDLASLWL
jgi:Uma2 family endonuclease